jgi:Taurine catabolism dioxygenase TauD, TfdA family
VGLPFDVSRDLLRVFATYVTRPEHIVRWSWRPGDAAIWDNRATPHYAVNDYGDADRVVERVTVPGVPPVGLDGWRSEARRGDASSYQAGFGARASAWATTNRHVSPIKTRSHQDLVPSRSGGARHRPGGPCPPQGPPAGAFTAACSPPLAFNP